MLGKLLKYDLRQVAPKMLLLYLFVFIIAIYQKLVYKGEGGTINTAVLGLSSVLVWAAILIGIYFITVFSFRKTLLKGQGYLTFTLPVSTSNIVFSKILCFCIFMILSHCVAFALVYILLGDTWDNMIDIIHQVNNIDNGAIVIKIVSSVVEYLGFVMLVCASVAAQNLVSKNRRLIPLVIFIGAVIFRSTLTNTIQIVAQNWGNYKGQLIINLVLNIIFLIAEICATIWILSKKLNLE